MQSNNDKMSNEEEKEFHFPRVDPYNELVTKGELILNS